MRLRALSCLLVAATACGQRSAPRAGTTSRAATAAPSSADSGSAVPRLLARFRAQVGPAPAHLDGPRSRDSLVAAFARAIERRDTTALTRLALTAAEFAWLYYPESSMSRPPYSLDPDVMWMQIAGQSQRGAARTLRAYGGALGYQGYRCEAAPTAVGVVRLYERCVVRHRAQGRTIEEPLFGSIIERDGFYKFVGLANRL